MYNKYIIIHGSLTFYAVLQSHIPVSLDLKNNRQCPYTCINNQTCLSAVSHSDLPVVYWLPLSALISQTPFHTDPTTEAKELTICTTQSSNN